MTADNQMLEAIKQLRAARDEMEFDIFRCTENAIAKFRSCTGLTPSGIQLDFYSTNTLGKLGEQMTAHRLASVRADIDFDSMSLDS